MKVLHLSPCMFFGTFFDGIWNTDTCVPHAPKFVPIEPRGAEKRANPKNFITHKSYIAFLVRKALFARRCAICGHLFHGSKRSGWKENRWQFLAIAKSKRARKCQKRRFSHANTPHSTTLFHMLDTDKYFFKTHFGQLIYRVKTYKKSSCLLILD